MVYSVVRKNVRGLAASAKLVGFLVACWMVFLTAIFYGNRAEAQEDFNGYPCTQDCSGHQAGHDWAEQNGITDSGDCGGNSQSFIEGCQSYTEENYSVDEDDYLDDVESDDAEDVEE